MQHDEQDTEKFTIIHIPEEQPEPNYTNTHNITPTTCDNLTENTDILIDNCQTNCQEIANKTSTELLEQQFVTSVENLDLDLIVKTYEVLQSCDNADALIKNWLAKCSRKEEQDVNKLTLEENLQQFIQFSQKVNSK